MKNKPDQVKPANDLSEQQDKATPRPSVQSIIEFVLNSREWEKGLDCPERKRNEIRGTIVQMLSQLEAEHDALVAALKKCENVIGMARLQGKLSDNALSPVNDALIARRS